MNLVVSDYDQTFFKDEESLEQNKIYVEKFMKNNLFVIATGRSYLDFEKEEQKYNIKYNYLILNHGATIVKDNVVIYSKYIDSSIKQEIIPQLQLQNSLNYFACSNIDSRADINLEKISKINISYKNKLIAKKIYNLLQKKYSKYLNLYLVTGGKSLEIVPSKVDKAEAIKYISNIENIPKNKIYTIGDSYSDLEMIKRYNGYYITGSIKEIKKYSQGKYTSVYQLIKDILNGNI